MIEVYDHPTEEIEIKVFGIMREICEYKDQVEQVPYMRFPNDYLRNEKLKYLYREIDLLEWQLELENNKNICC